jgi:hypothetical protein
MYQVLGVGIKSPHAVETLAFFQSSINEVIVSFILCEDGLQMQKKKRILSGHLARNISKYPTSITNFQADFSHSNIQMTRYLVAEG